MTGIQCKVPDMYAFIYEDIILKCVQMIWKQYRNNTQIISISLFELECEFLFYGICGLEMVMYAFLCLPCVYLL